MDGTTWLILVSIAAAAGIAVVFNRLIAARNACANARGSIDANLKKRHDLIPNLVSVVRGYASHERETLVAVAQARAQAAGQLGTSQSAAAETQLSRALIDLETRIEAYPQLKASDEFARLARTLTEIEEQISASRRAFNAHVMLYNNLVQQFPTLFVARLAGFASKAFFSTTDNQAPNISMGS